MVRALRAATRFVRLLVVGDLNDPMRQESQKCKANKAEACSNYTWRLGGARAVRKSLGFYIH